jgi:hypothetical protein
VQTDDEVLVNVTVVSMVPAAPLPWPVEPDNCPGRQVLVVAAELEVVVAAVVVVVVDEAVVDEGATVVVVTLFDGDDEHAAPVSARATAQAPARACAGRTFTRNPRA